MARKRKIIIPTCDVKFCPETDKPLRYFSVNDVFVRVTPSGNYHLFCNGFLVVIYDHDGYFYKLPMFHTCNKEYVDEFMRQYAPHFDYEKKKHFMPTMMLHYIGKPEKIKI